MSRLQWPAAVQVSLSLDDVCARGWDRLVGDFDVYLASPWLRVEERVAAVQPTYLVAELDQQLSAGLTCYLLGPDTPAWPFARLDAFLLRLLRESGSGSLPAAESVLGRALPTVLCGGRRPGHARLLLAPELDPAARREQSRQVVHAAEQLARDHAAASVSFLYVDDDDHLLRETLAESGYVRFASARASRLVVPPTFDDYLEGLSHNRRDAVRKESRKLAAAGLNYRPLPLDDELIAQILPLELALYDKYATEFPPAEAARLHRAVADALGDRVRVLTASDSERVRGFVTFVRWRDTLFARQGGFDYAFQGKLPLYFGLAFYAAVEYAQAVGAHYIEYGIGSEQAKASRGCYPRQQFGYFKIFDAHDHAAVAELVEELPKPVLK